jgi:hypothetical protein
MVDAGMLKNVVHGFVFMYSIAWWGFVEGSSRRVHHPICIRINNVDSHGPVRHG